jgi:hypothetical protein
MKRLEDMLNLPCKLHRLFDPCAEWRSLDFNITFFDLYHLGANSSNAFKDYLNSDGCFTEKTGAGACTRDILDDPSFQRRTKSMQTLDARQALTYISSVLPDQLVAASAFHHSS